MEPPIVHRLRLLAPVFSVARLDPDVGIPESLLRPTPVPFLSITRTPHELSLIAPSALLSDQAVRSDGWRALSVIGPLDFSLVGVVATLSTTLARAGISVLTVASHDTDCVLVRDSSLDAAIRALRQDGHEVVCER